MKSIKRALAALLIWALCAVLPVPVGAEEAEIDPAQIAAQALRRVDARFTDELLATLTVATETLDGTTRVVFLWTDGSCAGWAEIDGAGRVLCVTDATDGTRTFRYDPDAPSVAEVVAQWVNLRKTPGGRVLYQFRGGETATLLAEARAGGALWLRVSVEDVGEGYVQAGYAIATAGTMLSYRDGEAFSTLTGYRKHFFRTAAYWQATGALSRWSAEDRLAFVRLMYQDHMIAWDGRRERLDAADTADAAREAMVNDILRTHYGTDASLSLDEIFAQDWRGEHPADMAWREETIAEARRHAE